MGLESYPSRYTYQLTQWSEDEFKRRGINYEIVNGDMLESSGEIVAGQVLDAHTRSYYSLSQIMRLVALMRQGKITSDDVIFFEDMFTPGIESLAYIMDQIDPKWRPRVYVRCLAQTIDPDDFTNNVGMTRWMRSYEHMVNGFVTAVLASNEEMVMHAKLAGWDVPIYNISGLSFGLSEVLSRVPAVQPFDQRSYRVSFASRWDTEKQPHYFMDFVEKVKANTPHIKFTLLSGKALCSNDQSAVERARQLEQQGKLEIEDNLSKNQYYGYLNDSRVLINTALQDWVSNTLSEADALGCNVLFPAYRSFPEIFANDHERMYVPWSLQDMENKLYNLMDEPHAKQGQISKWTDRTIGRILDIMQGTGEQWRRDSWHYRNQLNQTKY